MSNKLHIREAQQFCQVISGARLSPRYVEHKTSVHSKQRARDKEAKQAL